MRFLILLIVLSASAVYGQLSYELCPNLDCLKIEKELHGVNKVSVFLLRNNIRAERPVSGKLTEVGSQLIFHPRFSFSQDQHYLLEVTTSDQLLTAQFRPEMIEKTNAPNSVVAVYPTTSILPMNQLKIYVEFSSPMVEGKIYDHIKLVNRSVGVEEKDAFIRMGEELWDSERKRLTLFFDPGRIKRGVSPNLQLGLPLQAGNSYHLVIENTLKDANGNTLAKDFTKEFTVTQPDREKPNVENWEYEYPQAGTSQALKVRFPEPLDYALLQRFIKVRDAVGRVMEGEIAVSDCEKAWSFEPLQDWEAGDYELVVNSWLEDLAGNNLSRLFDINISNQEEQAEDYRTIVFPFTLEKTNGIFELK